MVKGEQEQWVNIQAPCLGGWNNFLEAESIDDQQAADAQNIVFDGGFIQPRGGSALFAAKPTGESAAPLQLIEAVTSDSLEYLIAVYGASFHLYNPLVSDWVKLNQSYTPTSTDLYWGYINWNSGRGDDQLYACNGVDSFIRWDMCVTQVAVGAAGGAATITVDDASRFPASGTLILKSGGNEFIEAYSSKAGNVFTLTGTLNSAIVDGDSCVLMAVEKSSMEKGRVLCRHQSRLFVANKFGAETSGWYSVTNSPENFTTGSTVTAASTFTIADGNGGITGMHDFGAFLLIEKEDSHHRFEIVVASDLASKLDKIQPIISGTSVGTLSQQATIKMFNKLYYPTRTEGFIGLDPRTSGDSASTGLDVLSLNIQLYVTKQLYLSDCKGVAYRQNALWTVGRVGASQNTFVLMYDTLRKAWTRFTGWSVKDWGRANGNLYFLENGTGKVMQCFTAGYNDVNNPYEVSALTKRWNFGVMSQAKTEDKIYIQGYMTPQADIFIDVYFNELGSLDKQTFRINKDTVNLLYKVDIGGTLGSEALADTMLGGVSFADLGNVSFFRGYLGISNRNGFYNIQCRVRSNKEAFWGLTGLGFNPELNKSIDAKMVMSPELST